MVNYNIEINNAKTRFIRTNDGGTPTIKEIPTSSFLSVMQGEDIVLPENTRIYKKISHEKYIFVTEQEPMFRTIKIEIGLTYRWRQFHKWCKENEVTDGPDYFRDKFKTTTFPYRENPYHFHVLTPYMVYITMLWNCGGWTTRLKVFCNNKPITSKKEQLYVAPFFNLHGTGSVCAGYNIYEDIKELPPSPTQAVTLMNGSFWRTTFNRDYPGHIRKYKDIPEYSNYFIWEYLSKFNPAKLMSLKLVPHTTLDTIIDLTQRSLVSTSQSKNIKRISQFFPSVKF